MKILLILNNIGVKNKHNIQISTFFIALYICILAIKTLIHAA